MRTDFSASGRWLHTLTLIKMTERGLGLYSEGYEERISGEIIEDLVAAFGPMSEGRYDRGPFDVSESGEHSEYYYAGLPDEFMSEHLASLARIQAASA